MKRSGWPRARYPSDRIPGPTCYQFLRKEVAEMETHKRWQTLMFLDRECEEVVEELNNLIIRMNAILMAIDRALARDREQAEA